MSSDQTQSTTAKRASIIISFYNNIAMLKHILRSLENQYNAQFEVIIADDGSAREVVEEVLEIKKNYSFEIRHVWQEDIGFGKSIILNKSVLLANNDFLIFIDGDCVPQKHFVEDHLNRLGPGVCQAGRRVDVYYDGIKQIDSNAPEAFFKKNWLKILYWSITSRTRNFEKGIRVKSTIGKYMMGKKKWSLVGCNFSLHRQDLIAINGFDERANVPWGAEDADLDRRLRKFGVCIESLNCQAIAIHFDHAYFKRGSDKVDDSDRVDIFKLAKLEDQSWTPFGIIKK